MFIETWILVLIALAVVNSCGRKSEAQIREENLPGWIDSLKRSADLSITANHNEHYDWAIAELKKLGVDYR